MQIEYEATFLNIDKNKVRQKLKQLGAKLIKSEFLQKRQNFYLPKGHEIKGAWIRVRDEGDKITLSLKMIDGNKIKNQKEICLKIDNFDLAISFFESIGCRKKAYQETKRELWTLDNVEICLDEWPFLEPFIEIEGLSEKEVKEISKKLGFDYKKAYFGAVDVLYSQKYNISTDDINRTKEINFKISNPFLK